MENIEDAIACLERHNRSGAVASPDRKVMQRFDHFLVIAAGGPAQKEYARLKAAREKIIQIKRLRDALAHGSVSCRSEGGNLPPIMAFNIERGRKIRHDSNADEVQRHCMLLGDASSDLHLVARRIAYGF